MLWEKPFFFRPNKGFFLFYSIHWTVSIGDVSIVSDCLAHIGFFWFFYHIFDCIAWAHCVCCAIQKNEKKKMKTRTKREKMKKGKDWFGWLFACIWVNEIKIRASNGRILHSTKTIAWMNNSSAAHTKKICVQTQNGNSKNETVCDQCSLQCCGYVNIYCLYFVIVVDVATISLFLPFALLCFLVCRFFSPAHRALYRAEWIEFSLG